MKSWCIPPVPKLASLSLPFYRRSLWPPDNPPPLVGPSREGILVSMVALGLKNGVDTERADYSPLEVGAGRDLCNDVTD